MENAVAHGNGWIVSPAVAWIVLAAWVVVVLAYGLWRSRGEAPQDMIRPSGPTD